MKQITIIGVILVGLSGGALIFLYNWHIPAPSAVVTKTIADERFSN